MFIHLRKSLKGQALVEYLLILVFISVIGVKTVQGLGSFFGKSTGNLAYVLSRYLTVGVCPKDCFFTQYKNGYPD